MCIKLLSRRALKAHHALLTARYSILERLHERLVKNSVLSLILLGEIQFPDIVRPVMTRNDEAALVRNKGIARIEEFHVTDDLGQRVELHRPVDDADQLTALQHRIGEHTDELARGAGDRRRCKKWLLRLAHLFDVVTRRAIHILSRIAVRLPLRGRKGNHRKAGHLLLQRLQSIDARLARAVRDDRTAGKPVQQIRLALHIVGELHRRHLPNQLCVLAHTLKQLTARHKVTDPRKNNEADQKQRQ